MDLVLLVVAPVCIAVGVGVSLLMAWLDGCVDAERRRVGKTKRGDEGGVSGD